jgi:hypothetical protein
MIMPYDSTPDTLRHSLRVAELMNELIKMLADWKAATERTSHGDLAGSLTINRERFGIAPQLMDILANTARHFGWLAAESDHNAAP